MLKNLSQLSCKVGEKDFHFSCDMDSSLDAVKEALFQFQKHVFRIEDQVKAQQEAKVKEESDKKALDDVKVEEPKVEELVQQA